MLYSYLEFPDGTQIAYSNVCEDNTVEVRVERPVDGGFDTAVRPAVIQMVRSERL